ncbi:MAG: terminase [Opitutaceae bacterium]|nr:terminase [Opitutaceae bacterium]
MAGPEIIWQPHPGSQQQFMSCPIYEALYEGTRGPGKTDALLMDFAQHCGSGFGPHWRGVLFRETYPQLADVVAKSKRVFFRAFPGIKFNAGDFVWNWPTGEQLYFRHMRVADDYWNYHGHEYPWIGWEELTNWPDIQCYDSMKACSRASYPGMPRKYRSTANPYGVGHAWVKQYFIDPAPRGVVIRDGGMPRVRITGFYFENKTLMVSDPDYVIKLQSIADENKRKAWLGADWNIVSGGMFDGTWREEVHVLKPFAIPPQWRIDRSFDWGSSAPFSVGWWAVSDGTEVVIGVDDEGQPLKRAFPRGTLFRIAEWYGWSGKANEGCRMLASEIARGIKAKEVEMGLAGRVQAGPADSAIFDTQNGVCIADDFARGGIRWERADKSPGSRRNGWERVREYLAAGLEHPMEKPGLFVFDTCRHFIRTVPSLPRDKKDPDDVDTAAEDHVGDEVRYRVLMPARVTSVQTLVM